jgi:ABC-2 type transport system permease protein
MNVIKYYHIGRVNLQNALFYVIDFLVSAVLVAMILFILISLWKVLYIGRPVIAGFSFKQMIWYLAFTESLVFIPIRTIIKEMEHEIKSGDIVYHLNKPYNYITAKLATIFGGATLIRSIMVFPAAIIMALIFVGAIEIGIYQIIFGIIAIILAITLVFLIAASIAMLAFWLEESYAFYFIYDKMRFILGGFLFPLEILPIWLEIPARYLPFSPVLYYPARLIVDFSFSFLAKTMFLQIGWIAIFIGIISLMYKFGIKKVSVHGG